MALIQGVRDDHRCVVVRTATDAEDAPDYGLRPSSGLRVLRLVSVGDSPKDFAAFVEGELKRFADKGTLGVKLSGYQPE